MIQYKTAIKYFLFATLVFGLPLAGCASKKNLAPNNNLTGSSGKPAVEMMSKDSNLQATTTPVGPDKNSTSASTPTPAPAQKLNETSIAEVKQDIPVTQNKLPQGSASSKEKAGVLTGKVICIDPGHQSKANFEQEPIAPNTSITKEKMTYGTAGVATGIPEYKLNLEVSQKLKEALQKNGANVVMTRETHDVNTGNVERAKFANDSKAELVVRIHADGIDNSTVKGVSILYPGKKYLSDSNLLKNSKLAAEKILNSIIASTGANSRGIIERDDLTGFNWSTVPVILIEMGFMTNPEEDRLLNSSDYQDKMVEGMVKGLEEYFRVEGQ